MSILKSKNKLTGLIALISLGTLATSSFSYAFVDRHFVFNVEIENGSDKDLKDVRISCGSWGIIHIDKSIDIAAHQTQTFRLETTNKVSTHYGGHFSCNVGGPQIRVNTGKLNNLGKFDKVPDVTKYTHSYDVNIVLSPYEHKTFFVYPSKIEISKPVTVKR